MEHSAEEKSLDSSNEQLSRKSDRSAPPKQPIDGPNPKSMQPIQRLAIRPSGLSGCPDGQLFSVDLHVVTRINRQCGMKQNAIDRACQWILPTQHE